MQLSRASAPQRSQRRRPTCRQGLMSPHQPSCAACDGPRTNPLHATCPLLQIKFVMDKERMPHKLGSGAQGTVYEVGGGEGGGGAGVAAPGALRCRLGALHGSKPGLPSTPNWLTRLSPSEPPAVLLCPGQPPTQALLNGVEPVAVKVVPLGDATAAFLHEARMLRSLRHRNVVHLVSPRPAGPLLTAGCPWQRVGGCQPASC